MPYDHTRVVGEFAALAPVQFCLPGLVHAHDAVHASFLEQPYQLITTERPICQHHIAIIEAITKVVKTSRIVSPIGASYDIEESSCSYVEDAYCTHYRETASGSLPVGLRKLTLIFGCVVETKDRAVN